MSLRKSDLFPSTYYRATDVQGGPILLTIGTVTYEPVGEGAAKENKPVIRFKEKGSKMLVVFPTKFDAIALIAKADDAEDWPETQIVLELGKATYQGKSVDSIAIRAPKKPMRLVPQPPPQSAPPAAAALTVAEDMDDEIPF